MTPSIETVADRLNQGWYEDDPGIRFARRPERVTKDLARGRVQHYIAKWHPKTRPLRILTMPGVAWSFEKWLLSAREYGKGYYRPRCTFITAIERSSAVWTASLLNMPGRGGGWGGAVACPDFARAVIRTHPISRFFLCAFEQLALAENYDHGLDAAWLDFCGPLTVRRVKAIRRFWDKNLTGTLVLTSLKARWPKEISEVVRSQGISGLLLDALPNALVMSDLEYMDGSPMHQIVLRKRNW